MLNFLPGVQSFVNPHTELMIHISTSCEFSLYLLFAKVGIQYMKCNDQGIFLIGAVRSQITLGLLDPHGTRTAEPVLPVFH